MDERAAAKKYVLFFSKIRQNFTNYYYAKSLKSNQFRLFFQNFIKHFVQTQLEGSHCEEAGADVHVAVDIFAISRL